MARQQDDIYILIKFADFLHHLIAAYGCHQKIQKQYVIISLPHPFDGEIRIIDYIHIVTGTLKICL